MPHVDVLKIYSYRKHCEKGKNACKKQFFLFSQCFPPYMALILHIKCTLKCRLKFVSIWTILKFCCVVMGQFLNNDCAYLSGYLKMTLYWPDIANFHGHALSAVSLMNKSMKKSMSPVKVREFPEFGEFHLCVIANR